MTEEKVSSSYAIHLGDPVAVKTGWCPLRSGSGQTYRGHGLVQVEHNRLEFRGTPEAKLVSLLSVLAALLCAGLAIHKMDTLPLLGTIIFAGAGICFFPATIVFDRRTNLFWKDTVLPLGRNDGRPRSGKVPLKKIYAIQILSKLISGECAYYSHELNLVLEDGSRINVVDQTGLEELRKEADMISRFLGRPVWEK